MKNIPTIYFPVKYALKVNEIHIKTGQIILKFFLSPINKIIMPSIMLEKLI